MSDPTRARKEQNVGGSTFESLFTEFIKEKFNITPDYLSKLVLEDVSRKNSIPVSILRSEKLSSLEAIVKFLRENRKLSYNMMAELLYRKPKALSSTYTVAHRKMHATFSTIIDDDKSRIPFTAFTNRLSVLECICTYLKSQNHSYADIARMISKDQRTVWTVCKRAEKKLGKDVGKNKIDYGRKAR